MMVMRPPVPATTKVQKMEKMERRSRILRSKM